MPSADNLYKPFGPDKVRQNVTHDLDTNCLVPDFFFKTVDFEQNHQTAKNVQNFQVIKISYFQLYQMIRSNFLCKLAIINQKLLIFPQERIVGVDNYNLQ